MTKEELHCLAAQLEGGEALDPAETTGLATAVSAAFPERPLWDGARAAALATTDGVLGLLAEALPSWSVHISGQSAAVSGRWTCTVRETGVRDDDELIGVGKADTPARAVAAALLKVAEMKRRE